MKNWVVKLTICFLCSTLWGQESPDKSVATVDSTGSGIELNDGSMWVPTNYMSEYAIRYWQNDDTVLLCPASYCWLMRTKFCLYNCDRKEVAAVRLSMGPLLGTPQYLQIVEIDPDFNEVVVQNGLGLAQEWVVHSADKNELRSWSRNHSVVMGSSDYPFQEKERFPYIIVNVNRNNYARVGLPNFVEPVEEVIVEEPADIEDIEAPVQDEAPTEEETESALEETLKELSEVKEHLEELSTELEEVIEEVSTDLEHMEKLEQELHEEADFEFGTEEE